MQAEIDTSKPHAARIYDYLLGGKDHFAIDRETAEKGIKLIPTGRTAARENRTFLGRAVRYLVAEAGIRQFLDIGTGLPSANNVHEVAQAEAPESRVVYVDNDPIVLAHARALLTSTPQGRSAYIEADLCEPGTILGAPALAATLDMTKPVALMLVGLLHFVPDEQDPARAVATLVDALPPGSYVTVSHGSPEFNPEAAAGVQPRGRGGLEPHLAGQWRAVPVAHHRRGRRPGVPRAGPGGTGAGGGLGMAAAGRRPPAAARRGGRRRRGRQESVTDGTLGPPGPD